MPNWVYSSVKITGKVEDLETFIKKSTQPRPQEDGKMSDEYFSFWNFVSPSQDIVDSGEYFGIHGYADGKSMGDTSGNWYNWNVANWGTKWDACDAYIGKEDITTGSISISYNTAWSIPEPVMGAMVDQHRELRFEFWCEEEQGWGSTYVGENGEVEETHSWDIPNSHADYVAKDDVDGCVCSHFDDEEEWYEDCPRDTNDPNRVIGESEMRADFEKFAKPTDE